MASTQIQWLVALTRGTFFCSDCRHPTIINNKPRWCIRSRRGCSLLSRWQRHRRQSVPSHFAPTRWLTSQGIPFRTTAILPALSLAPSTAPTFSGRCRLSAPTATPRLGLALKPILCGTWCGTVRRSAVPTLCRTRCAECTARGATPRPCSSTPR
jgi:hypothetical protein